MTYTLWSRGRLLGESPLDFVRCLPRLRVGFLRATPLGEKLLPVASSVTATSLAFGKALRSLKENCPEEDWRRLPEYADYQSACDEEAAMALELRGPDGNTIPTENIAVRDTEFLMSWSANIDECADAGHPDTDNFDPGSTRAEEACDTDAVLPWDRDEDDMDVDALVAEFEALSAEDAADACWRPPREGRPWMRYQLQVTLGHDWLIP